jgi:hypothetical protein
MGYTHYYKQPAWNAEDEKGFRDALPAIQDILKRHKNILRLEYNSDKEPEANGERIQFNGMEESGYETFILENHLSEFSFCKTAEKPYDVPVCEVLLVLMKHCPNLQVSSDGFSGYSENPVLKPGWMQAIENVRKHYGLDYKPEVTIRRERSCDIRPVLQR